MPTGDAALTQANATLASGALLRDGLVVNQPFAEATLRVLLTVPTPAGRGIQTLFDSSSLITSNQALYSAYDTTREALNILIPEI